MVPFPCHLASTSPPRASAQASTTMSAVLTSSVRPSRTRMPATSAVICTASAALMSLTTGRAPDFGHRFPQCRPHAPADDLEAIAGLSRSFIASTASTYAVAMRLHRQLGAASSGCSPAAGSFHPALEAHDLALSSSSAMRSAIAMTFFVSPGRVLDAKPSRFVQEELRPYLTASRPARHDCNWARDLLAALLKRLATTPRSPILQR